MPLCVMKYEDVLRQQLLHRAVALLVRDRKGRALLTQRQNYGWGMSSFGRLRAGISSESKAQEMLLKDLRQSGPVLQLGIAQPGMESLNCFVYLFEARVSAAVADEAVRNADNHMLVDYDELRGLGTHFGELLSPFLRMLVQKGLVRPR